ncbi:inner centromere protein isoform X5 [Panthera leo]|nr:inner centromere protein isoform X5 [Panthera leo]XP_042761856.1 inner centromere protein isoform X5 [Panthera leo]XP_042761858.1 inner centromere protein isoform X5 [Panthera leo]XP_042761859.1 inner centromere protein isoform X5 [Panthera leo]XP_042761860.1 inner centromere protein isoform X5 [Panthera leo]
MGSTAPGPIHLLELCDQKLMEFICNVDNKDLVWLEEIEEEAQRMFTSEFSKEPELMPKTPSQKNRRKKRRVSYIQDENRDPIRKSRLSRRRTRSSQLSSRHLRSKDKVEKLATVVGENGSVLRRVTRAAAAAAAATAALAAPSPTPESPTVLAKEPENSLAQGPLVPVVEIGVSERQSAELHLGRLKSARAPSPTPSLVATAPASHSILISDEESTPQKPEAGRLASVTVSSLMATPQDPKRRGGGASRSASKLRIAQASPGPQDLAGSPASPWQERVLVPILPDNCSTPTGAHIDPQSVRRSLIAPSSPGRQVSLAQKYSLVAKQEKPVRRSSRRIGKKATEEPAASARIICHSYLERLLNIEVPQKVGPEQKRPSEEAEPAQAAEPEGPKQDRSTLWPRSATKIAISTPGSQPVAGGQETPSKGRQEPKTDQADGPKEPPQSVRRKRSYKQAVSELDEEPQLEDEEELQPPRSKTPSPPCPASKVVRPLRTFLHTVQRNQMLMTPTSAPRSSVMKSFIKRNTPLRVDPKCSFVEKERQRLENLRRKEEAEQLRRQKVEEDKRRRLEEVKLKREERLRKVLQARERVEQMKEEKKKQIEQKFAQIDEKTEKVKEERLAEEKAKKKAAAKKMEEVEARRKQEEEARRLRRLQQDEEERRHQELLQKKREEEQERLRRAAEAKRLAEQREHERQLAEQREHERQLAEQQERERRREQERLQAERELQEREKALRLERELEEKKKKEEQQRLAEERLLEERQRKAREAAAASKGLNVTVDVQSPACTSYQMTPQGHRPPPKINPDNYGMDLNSDDSTDDEAHPRKPIPTWARGTQLSQAIIHQYHHPPNLLELFGTILPLDLEDIFKKSKPRYHKRTSSAVWNSPPLLGPRVPNSLAYGLKKY